MHILLDGSYLCIQGVQFLWYWGSLSRRWRVVCGEGMISLESLSTYQRSLSHIWLRGVCWVMYSGCVGMVVLRISCMACCRCNVSVHCMVCGQDFLAKYANNCCRWGFQLVVIYGPLWYMWVSKRIRRDGCYGMCALVSYKVQFLECPIFVIWDHAVYYIMGPMINIHPTGS